MSRNSLAVAFVATFTILVSSLVFGTSSASYASTPSAGNCSEATGDWVCNVENQDLSFKTVGEVTQDPDNDPTVEETFDPDAGESIVYRDVFTDGSVVINARLTVAERSSAELLIDYDFEGDDGIWTYVGDNPFTGTSNTADTNTRYTVEFFEAESGRAVRLINVEILVKDIDGYQKEEFAAFRGLNSYVVTTDTELDVATTESVYSAGVDPTREEPGAENPDPETGVRQFLNEDLTTSAGDMVTDDEKAWVGVRFDSVLSIGFQAGNRDTTRGAVGFIFTDIDTAFTDPTQEINVADASYTVTYDNNSGDADPPAAQSFTGAQDLSEGTGMSKSGVNISSWNTQANGSGTSYALGSSYTAIQDTTLYAIYESKTVTFNANGGSGSNYTQTSSGPTSLTSNTFTRSGFSLSSWNTATDGSGASYADGASFPFASDDTLYAQWTVATPETSATSSEASSGIFLYLASSPGRTVDGCPVYYGSVSIKPNSTYVLSLQAVTNPALTRTVLASGTTNDWGHVDERLEMGELSPGTYKVVMTGTHRDGYPLVLTNYISVNQAGNFISLSPESLQPTLN